MSTVADRDVADESLSDSGFTSKRPLDYLPGLLLLAAVGLAGKYAEVGWLALAKRWEESPSGRFC